MINEGWIGWAHKPKVFFCFGLKIMMATQEEKFPSTLSSPLLVSDIISIVQSLSNQMKCKILRWGKRLCGDYKANHIFFPFFVLAGADVKFPDCAWFNILSFSVSLALYNSVLYFQINPRTLITTMENWSLSRTVKFSPFHCIVVTVRRLTVAGTRQTPTQLLLWLCPRQA